MGFAWDMLWVMGYCGLMGYGMQIPAHQLGGPIVQWDIRGYGLPQVWVKRSLTVQSRIDCFTSAKPDPAA